jgi:cell division protein FtsN
MEKQKIFWIVLSVSVFMVVVLVVGVLMLKQGPVTVTGTQTISPLADPGTRVYEYTRESPTAREPTPAEPDSVKVTVGEEPRSVESPAAPAAVPEKPKLAAPAAKAAPAARPAPVRPAVKTVKTVEYWIQTGSYKSQSRAEDLAKLLSDKGLAGRVSSFTAKKEGWFRVRIGPYTNKAEAEKFLAIVKQIQGLQASYLSSVMGSRPVN